MWYDDIFFSFEIPLFSLEWRGLDISPDAMLIVLMEAMIYLRDAGSIVL